MFAGVDACLTPVLELTEAAQHHHNVSKQSFTPGPAGPEPVPAPRLSRSPAQAGLAFPKIGQHSKEILQEFGYNEIEVNNFIENQIVEINSDVTSKL